VQLFRTLCVVAVLGALSYGAYVTLTQSPPVEPALDAVNWDSPPRIELPGTSLDGKSATAAAPAATATGSAAKFGSTAPGGAARLSTPHDTSGAPLSATITGVRAQPSTSAAAPPANYPSTNVPPGPLDGSAAAPMTNIVLGPASTSAPSATSATPSTGSTPANAAAAANPASPAGPALGMPAPTNTAAAPAAPSTVTPATNMAASSSTPPGATMIPSAAAPATAPPDGATTAPFDKVQLLLGQNKPAAALELLSGSFDNPQLSADDDRRVMELLDQLAGTVIYSNEHLLEAPHVVQPGERIDQIAARYQISWELLAKINGLPDPWNVAPGTKLKVVQGPFDALVDKGRRRLSLFLEGMYAGSFAVGFGRDRPPSDGLFAVANKTPSPLRVLDLGNGMAIHTQNDALSLQTDDAPGCIRLSPRDAEDVYDLLGIGSKVIVRP
jgi:LysM repeat protein